MNGWTNYETWKIALCIQNDEVLYKIASKCRSYAAFKRALRKNFPAADLEFWTHEGVSWDNKRANEKELDELIAQIREQERK